MTAYGLGIDTSNYTTSAALCAADGTILAENRRLLRVPEHGRGLRQQEALFQHITGLPDILNGLFEKAGRPDRTALRFTACSTRPRAVEHSYMPVFEAGILAASAVSEALGIPRYDFSHQSGHIAAASAGTRLEDTPAFIAFHLSGGTTEAVLAEDPGDGTDYRVTLLGKTEDLSFGQLIDRVGVSLGYAFPAGKALDDLALSAGSVRIRMPKVKVTDGCLHLSGLETHCQRSIGPDTDPAVFAASLLDVCADALAAMTEQVRKKAGTDDVLFSGGVASSAYIRKKLEGSGIVFGEPAHCTDNARGVAILGAKRYGMETGQRHAAE